MDVIFCSIRVLIVELRLSSSSFLFNEECKESKTLKEGFGSEKDKVIFPFICL